MTPACGSGSAHPVSLAHSACALSLLSIVSTEQSFGRVNVDTNDAIFVNADGTRLPEPPQDTFALDPVEAWEVDVARLVDQGILDFWKEIVYPVLALVPSGWNQALNVCQWEHEHIAEKEHRESRQRT